MGLRRISSRGLLLLAALLAGATLAQAQVQPCTLVFGHGRNHDSAQPAQDEAWNRLNASFNAAVAQAWAAAGRRAPPLVLPVAATDLAGNLERLLGEAGAQGCRQVLETTLFADYDNATLIARLRLYPLLGSAGPRAAGAQPAVGRPLFTSQREFELSARTLERLRPEALGRAMAEEALARWGEAAAH